MTRGRMESAWDHTAWLMWKLHNLNVEKKHRISDPGLFNPLRSKPRRRQRYTIAEMQQMHLGRS